MRKKTLILTKIICTVPFILYILVSFLALQLLYYLLFFGRFLFFNANNKTFEADQPPVSVVICAHNEAPNLRKNLPKVLMQSYPIFEVLLVDDASTDETTTILEEIKQDYPNLKVLKIHNKLGAGKKAALSMGIQEASYDWLLLTDADGQPHSTDWISQMIASRSPNTEIVLGYGPYISYPEWLNRWIRYETHYVALQYFSAACWGIPYMGVGRNLLYHKKVYKKYAGVFKEFEHLASGDDDLFISRAANHLNTNLCINPQSFVYSEPKRSIKALYRQKTRHYSTSTHYNWQQKLLLGVLSMSQIGFWVSMLFACFILHPFTLCLILLLRFLSILLIWTKTLCIFKDKKLLWYIILLDLISPIYYLILTPSLFVSKSSHWT